MGTCRIWSWSCAPNTFVQGCDGSARYSDRVSVKLLPVLEEVCIVKCR
ncbi:MAG TPA: hypothetical protein VHT34_10990 [Clostridia bacterium]|nr:hypothetical protein [Clostridia bacterium]